MYAKTRHPPRFLLMNDGVHRVSTSDGLEGAGRAQRMTVRHSGGLEPSVVVTWTVPEDAVSEERRL